jgi:O-antigen/teichoic acid export membrane protein
LIYQLQNFKKLNSSWLANLIAQTSGFLAFIIVSPLLINLLGKEQFGALALFILLPQIIVQLDLGLTTGAARAVAMFKAQNKLENVSRVLSETTFTLFLVAIVFCFIFYFTAPYLFHALHLDLVISNHVHQFIAAISCWCTLALINAGLSVPARAFERFKLLAIVQAISTVFFWLGALLFTYVGYGLLMILWWGSIVAILTLCILIFNNKEAKFTLTKFFHKITFIKKSQWLLPNFLKFGFGTFIAQASSLITYHADKFLVAALVSPSAAGIYTACNMIASKLLVLVTAIAAFVFPRAVRLNVQGSNDDLKEVYMHATNACVLAAIVFGIPIIVLADPFLHLWLKADYDQEYILVIVLMAIGYFFASFSVVASNVSIGKGHSKMPAIFAVLGGAGTLLLCIILAPKYGIVGAAGSAAIGMSQAVIFNWMVSRQFGSAVAKEMIFLLLKALLIGAILIATNLLFNPLISSWSELFVAAGIISIFVVLAWLVINMLCKVTK